MTSERPSFHPRNILLGADPEFSGYRNAFGIFLLVVLIFIVYSNTYQSSWHLDDYANILSNDKLHLTTVSPESIFQTLKAPPSKKNRFYRPVPMLTFGINWYLGGGQIWGFHFVNIIIHSFTAIFLFLFVKSLLLTPTVRNSWGGGNCKYFVALLTAVLWAIHPIQTQGVTYIVQRMAAMAAMFYILSAYFYLKARLSDDHHRWLYYAACSISFLLAVESKENAIILPIALILIEVTFFRSLKELKRKKYFYHVVIFVGFCVTFGIVLLFLNDSHFFSFMKGYEKRSFTLWQRLMTQPRVLVYHLSQLFYPSPERFSIEYAFQVSKGLFQPWTTLFSILAVCGLIFFALWQQKKMPILSFSILFFFLNHLIESSIVPLEIVFEHRNYLPTFFIFLPIACGIYWLLDHYAKRQRMVYWVIMAFVPLWVAGHGLGAYIRNLDWKTEKSLWEDALKKAPESGRAMHNLAWGYYEKIGDNDTAFALYEKALTAEGHTIYHEAKTFSNMAGLCLDRGLNEKAAELWGKALLIMPDYHGAAIRRIAPLVALERWPEAISEIDRLLVKKNNVELLNVKGFILIKNGKYKEALKPLRKALHRAPYNEKSLANLSFALMKLNYYKRSNFFLKIANWKYPRNRVVVLMMVENAIRTGDMDRKDFYVDKLFAMATPKTILTLLKETQKSTSVPISKDLLAPELAHRIILESGKLTEISNQVGELSP